MHGRLFLFPATLFLLLCGCVPDRETRSSALPVDAWLPLSISQVAFEVQVVLTPGEQQKGLMYREDLPANAGMLFPYREPRQMSFWMANTPLPLDIGFFDQHGVLLEIQRMVPFDTSSVKSRSYEAQFALEMHSGWFSKAGLLPGAQLDLKQLAEAISQRGGNPAEYGL